MPGLTGNTWLVSQEENMTLVRWSPFADFRRIDQVRSRVTGAGTNSSDRSWPVPLDVVKDGESFIVKASLPGVDPDKIEVTVGERGLEIKANADAEMEDRKDGVLLSERRTGAFYRYLRLPGAIDREKAESNYKDGILTVTLPSQESARTRKLKVIAA